MGMEPFFLKNEQYYLIKDWNNSSLVAGFTTKNGGVSEGDFMTLNLGFHVKDDKNKVCANREDLANSLDFPVEHWIGAEQTHEVNIVTVSQADRGRGASSYENSFQQTDGFFTREAGILLTLCYADCVPLYFYAPNDHAIGVAHAGWKGTVKGIGGKMVEVFKRENIDPKDVFVVIGPSICENCYIVDDRVIDLVQNILEDVEEKPYNLISDNQYQLNLKDLNRQLIKKSGVPEENIRVTSLCTSCDKEQFFSHRRDQGSTGRMMSFIGWKED